MTEASRVQKLLNEQNAEIDRLKNRIKKLEEALQLILDNDRNLHKPLEDLFAEFCIEARKALEGKDE